jgi:hypothetical protein
VAQDIPDVLRHRGLTVVERDQLPVPFERVDRAVGATTEPLRRRVEGPGDVVEHTVQSNPQTACVRGRDEPVEVRVIPEPRVDAEVINGVVAVRLGREHRAE